MRARYGSLLTETTPRGERESKQKVKAVTAKTHTKRLERASKPPGKAFAKTKVANGSKLAVAKTRRV
jgi:hypothetical protein